MNANATPKKATATKNIELSSILIIIHITTLQISINGARTAMRTTIWNAFCTLVTSVVIRVINPAVLNLSMLENENVWILAYMLFRRLYAKPDEAEAAYRPASTPNSKLNIAINNIKPPYNNTLCILPASIPLSINDAMIKGINTSINTSSAVKTGVKMVSFLYSLI